jgi:hypothetical protein
MPITKDVEVTQKPLGWLKPYAKNSRKHPASQIRKVIKSIEQFGFVNPILSDPEGEIIAGHCRHKAATSMGLTMVPVIILEGLTSAERRAYVIADNKLAEDAQWDEDLLKAEIDDLQLSGEIDIDFTGFDMGEIAALDPTLIDDGGSRMEKTAANAAPEGQEFDGIVVPTIVEEPILPSSNKWGIPDLLPDMLADRIPENAWYRMEPDANPSETNYLTWGEHRRERCQPEHTKDATMFFYEEDEAFQGIWNRKVDTVVRILEYGWGQIACPDFSCYRDAPLIIKQYAYYKQQYMGRYFQEAGIKVIPSLVNIDSRDYDWMLAGIPKNAPIVSCQVLTIYNKFTKKEGHEERSCFHKAINYAVETIEPQCILFYGGAPHEERMRPHLPEGPQYVFLQSLSALFASKRGNKSWQGNRAMAR